MYFGRLFIVFYCYAVFNCACEQYCEKDASCTSHNLKHRYLFYDVNRFEGFNLRRDVYLRFAVFAHDLQKSSDVELQNIKLVLPPWSNLYHWRSSNRKHIPWSHFFDMNSLQKFAPVMDMYEFFEDVGMTYGKIKIDNVYVLQHFEDMFKTGNFEDKMSLESCNEEMQTNFFYYDNVTSDNIQCLSFHGHASQLLTILKNSSSRSVLFDHGEVVLHDRFGDQVYWQARRSMRFNNELVQTAANFRKSYLNSDDESDGTTRPLDWRNEKPGRNAKGGPYLSVHLRRRDFVFDRPHEVPTIEDASKQIKRLLLEFDLKKVFIATDAVDKEYEELYGLLEDFEVYSYTIDGSNNRNYNEGQIAIIDQIICSHAKYFVGTHESTFSFRIREEREIIGFPAETTFNSLCSFVDIECEKPTMWKIMY